jgi:single-strand DNA-binding protein
MYNKIILIGRLTADPEMRYTSSGLPVANFTLAVDRGFTTKQGEKETDFIDIIVWRGLAENCAKYLKKGSMVAVDGRLQIRSYEDKQGVRRKVSEVVAENVRFLDRKDTQSQYSQGQGQQNRSVEDEFSEVSFTEDDLPF